MTSVADQLAKVLAEIERLRRDISRVYDRIEPFAKMPDWEMRHDRPYSPEAEPVDVESGIRHIRKAIQICEIEVSHACSLLKDISEHAPSREAMKPHIKNPPRRPRK